MTKDKRYQIAVHYTPEQIARLKKFLGVAGIESVGEFTAQALDAEIADRIERIEDKSMRESIKKLVG